MTTPTKTFFHYYRRYEWNETDFAALEESLRSYSNDALGALVQGAVLKGLDFTSSTGLQLSFASGVAVGPSGDLMVATGTSAVTVVAPTGANSNKSLVVIRPVWTESDYMVRPTDPFDSVPLHRVLSASVVLIQGTQAPSPSYPSIQSQDVVLMGVELSAGATGITATSNLNYQKRDQLGKNNDLGDLSPYDYVVGSSHRLCTHKSLKQLLADANVAAGSRVLVVDNETVDTSAIAITKANLEIKFKPGVTLTAGTSTTGMTVASSGVTIDSARFDGFSYAIIILPGGDYGMVFRPRFINIGTAEVVEGSSVAGGTQVLGGFTEV